MKRSHTWRHAETVRADVHVLMAAVLLVAALLRIQQLNWPLTPDEGATYISFVTRSAWRIVTEFGQGNNHPLCNLVARAAWCLGLDHEQLRWSTLLASLLSLGLFGYFVAVRYGALAAVWPTWLLAVCWPQVVYGARLRGYGWLAAGTLISTCLLLRAIETGRARWWVAYTLAIALTAYAHLWAVCVLVGQVLAVLALRVLRLVTNRAAWRALVAGGTAAGIITLLYLPMLPSIVRMLSEPRARPISCALGYAILWCFNLCSAEASQAAFVAIAALLLAGLAQLICTAWVGAGERANGQPLAVAAAHPISGDTLVAVGLGPVLVAALAVLLARPANFYPRFLIFVTPACAVGLAGVLGTRPQLRSGPPGLAPEAPAGRRGPGRSSEAAGGGMQRLPAAVARLRQIFGCALAVLAVASAVLALGCYGFSAGGLVRLGRSVGFSPAFFCLWVALALAGSAVALTHLPRPLQRICLWLILLAGPIAAADLLHEPDRHTLTARYAVAVGTAGLALWSAMIFGYRPAAGLADRR